MELEKRVEALVIKLAALKVESQPIEGRSELVKSTSICADQIEGNANSRSE